MNMLKSLTAKLSGGEKNLAVLKTLAEKTVCTDGIIYTHDGEKIGWYNEKLGIGWLNRKAYSKL